MGAVREAGGAESVAQKEELLRSKTKFGPYARFFQRSAPAVQSV